jgi:hypothetical protein
VAVVRIEDEEVLHLRHVRLDPLEHRCELGIDVHDGCIAVIGDVRRLLVAQPVVERHCGDAELARRVDHHHEADRVLAAPHDLGVSGHDAEAEQHVGEPVGLFVQLCVGELVDLARRAIVDDSELVALNERVGGEEIGHEDTSYHPSRLGRHPERHRRQPEPPITESSHGTTVLRVGTASSAAGYRRRRRRVACSAPWQHASSTAAQS